MERLIVIGGLAAGLTSALKANRTNPELEILLFDREPFIGYGICGLPYFLAGDIIDYNKLFVVDLKKIREQIQVNLNTNVVEINPRGGKIVTFSEEKRKHEEYFYDRLIIAIGAKASKRNLPGADLNGVFTLRNLRDALAIKSFMEQNRPDKAVVIGTGFMTLHTLYFLIRNRINVYWIRSIKYKYFPFDKEILDLIDTVAFDKGVKIIDVNEIRGIERGVNNSLNIVFDDKSIKTDMVMLCLGTEIDHTFLKNAGLRLGRNNGILVDRTLKTNFYNIYAAGDCTEFKGKFNYQTMLMKGALTANRMGRIAGENASFKYIRGRPKFFDGQIPTLISPFFEYEVAITGLNENQANSMNLKFDSVKIKQASKAKYFSNNAPSVHLKLLFEKPGGKIIGAQIFGPPYTTKRIDVLSLAIRKSLTVFELDNLDTAYSPGITPVWDPILIATRFAIDKLK